VSPAPGLLRDLAAIHSDFSVAPKAWPRADRRHQEENLSMFQKISLCD
jgi:hypothetical protein